MARVSLPRPCNFLQTSASGPVLELIPAAWPSCCSSEVLNDHHLNACVYTHAKA